MKLNFIGGGNMASALIGGLLSRGYAREQIQVVEVLPDARERLEKNFNVKTFSDVNQISPGECIILAVKPQQIREAALKLAPLLKRELTISIAAGIRTADLSRWLNGYKSIVRVMPNTPAFVHCAISALYALPAVSEHQKSDAEKILSAVGETLWLEDEAQMDAVTAVSGSGPAYVFYFLEALAEAARELGFDSVSASKLALVTFTGASKLAAKSDEDFATLRARVTSKGGTTERGLEIMEAAGLKQSIVRAIRAAAERSKELGRELGDA
ncbi:MAG: pyrroline-5-carboxylate reductase [Burkholderiales bacterium]